MIMPMLFFVLSLSHCLCTSAYISIQWIMIAINFDIFALGLDLLSKHFQTVIASVVDLARLALGAKVAVPRRQFVDDAVHPDVTFAQGLPVLFDGDLEIEHPELENVDEVVRLEAFEVRIPLELREAPCVDLVDALLEQLVQVVRLCGDQEFHAPRLGEEEFLALLLHGKDLVFFHQRKKYLNVRI